MSQPTFNADETLLIATNVQAHMVGAGAGELYDLAAIPRTQEDFEKWHFNADHFKPFAKKLRLPALQAGVHLHWTLPTVFVHAVHGGVQASEQPLLPNRWLILRVWHAPNQRTFSSKAWVVESDYVAPDQNAKGSAFPFFEGAPPKELNGGRLGYVGRVVDATVWKEEHPQYRFPLKSTGWGDPSFAGYYPACRSVLGFWDAMDGAAEGSLLTYLVMGWYSDPAHDLLRRTPFKEQFKDVPKRTLCHGGVMDLAWQGDKQRYPAAERTSTKRVAIGGSAAEALSALVAPDNPDLQQVLCTFQHEQAEQVSERYQLGHLLHRHAFSAVPGGKRWTLEPVDRPADAQTLQPPLSVNVHDLLKKLNDAQQALDRQGRELDSLRARLFACWVAWGTKQTGVPRNRPSRDVTKPAELELQTAKAKHREREAEVEGCKTAVSAALKVERTGMQLAESTLPPFLQPKDPFVVLDGEQLSDMQNAASPPDEKTAGNAISRARSAKDLLTGVRQAGDAFMAKDCFGVSIENALPLDEAARLLVFELLLLSPTCAELLEPTGKRLERSLFQRLQESLDQSVDANGVTVEWIGRPPDDAAATLWQGHNTWRPLYLMWQAYWAPAYAPQASATPHDRALADWKVSADETAADLTTSTKFPPPKLDVLLEGATLITALSGSHLTASLRRFAETAWPGARLSNLNDIDETKMVGQSFGGLNELLLRQALGLFVPPQDAVWDLIERIPQPSVPLPNTLFPVRAGALKIVNLWVVDAFGQTRKVFESDNSRAEPPKVIGSAALSPSDKNYHVAFSPRLVQPARLNFDCQPAQKVGASPVCGWIVPNFLDKSFIVFSANGEPLGALESVLPALGEKTISSKVTFKWRPIPGSTLEIGGIANEWLRNFLNLAVSFSADEGQAFLELVDLVLRKTDARLPPEDAAMSVLLGRPLALVRASLALELQGLPAGYWNTGLTPWKFETEGFEKLQVPVRLGSMRMQADGLVGYLTANNMQSFSACQQSIRRLSNSSRIQYDNEVPVALSNDPVALILLLDASAKVHASTGILPRCVLELPAEVSKQATLLEEVYFTAAPVLDDSAGADAQPTLPRPSDAFGQWSWSTRPTTGWHEIRPADDRARFVDQLRLTEGWLKLKLRRAGGSTATGNPT